MKKRKTFLVYVVLCLAIILTSVATTLALVKDEHSTSDTSIKFDKVAIMGHEENGSNLELTLTSDYVGDGELVFNGSGEKDYLWIKPTSDTADMFLRFRVYFTLGSEELDEVNADTLALLNNGNGVPEGFKLYEDESLDYELIPYDGWVYVCTINDEIIEAENKILKVVQNTTKEDKNYIISKEYRLDYDKENDEEAIFNMISQNDNQITLKVEAHAIQCFGLSNNIQDALEETQGGNDLILDSFNGQSLEESYGNVTLKNYVAAVEQNIGFSRIFSKNSPETISKISKIIADNNLTTEEVYKTYGWSLGDKISIKLSTNEIIEMQIIGFNHDSLSDGSGKAGITLQTVNCLNSQHVMHSGNTNKGGWNDSQMRSWLYETVFNTIPNNWKQSIKTVDKLTSNGSTVLGSSYGKLITSEDKLFLLSEYEVFAYCYYSLSGEGTQYEYYSIHEEAKYKIKYCDLNKDNLFTDNEKILWWLRSPNLDLKENYRGVKRDGEGGKFEGENIAKNAFGVSFAFCV